MKIAYLTGIIGLMLFTDAAVAEEAKEKTQAGVVRQVDSDTGDYGDMEERTGINDGRVMPPYETYDENTGLPDEVSSDAEGNL